MSDIVDRNKVFSGRKLTSLPKTQFSGLDFENIIEDISQLVTENPNYNKNWDDFLASNAGRMLVEFFSFIADQVATRIDWMVNENFIGTATQKKSIIRLLKLIGYNLSLPKASRVDVDIFLDRPVGSFYLSGTGVSPNIEYFSLTAQSLGGNERKTFEAIKYDENNERYEYRNSPIEIASGNIVNPVLQHKVSFFEGKTFVFTTEVTTNNNFTFTLPQFPVIDKSPVVYLLQGENQEKEIELLQVASFLDPKAQRETNDIGEENAIPYILNVLDQDIVEIEFGPTSLLPSTTRRPEIGNSIRVYYRVGGGEQGNITKRSINTSRRLNINDNNVNITFINNTQGYSGEEGEDAAYAAVFGPLQIKTVQKAVTEEDYDILLSSFASVLKSKSYGNNNLPSNFYNIYNVFMKPLEVWNFSILNKPGWREVKPSRYNDFEWIKLRLENRFNQNLSFTDGSFNKEIGIILNELQKNVVSLDYKNFIEIITSDEFKEAIKNNGSINDKFKLKITSKKLTDNYFFLTKENNIFSEKHELNNSGEIDFNKSVFSLKQEEKAYYISTLDNSGDNKFEITDGNDNKNLKISIDNREPITIDLAAGESLPASLTSQSIESKINTAFTSSEFYNNADNTPIKGTQELGLIIADRIELIPNALRNKEYYFMLNGVEYSFNTGEDIGFSYNDLLQKINESFELNFKGKIINQNDEVEIIDGYEQIFFVPKGSKIESVGESKPLNNYSITDVNYLTKTIEMDTLSTNTDNNHSFIIKPFIAEFVGTGGAEDIKITNLSETPYGVVYLQKSNRNEIDDLFSLLNNTLEVPVNSTGVPGYNKLGINGVITETRGFQAFVGALESTTGARTFKLSVDGVPTNGGNDWSISIDSSETLDTIRAKLLVALSTLVGVSIEIPEINVFDDLRIVSLTKGSASTIEITAPTAGSSLITHLGGLRNNIIGMDSPEIDVLAGEYSFKINNHIYKIDIIGNETYDDLITKLETVLDYYSVEIQDDINDDKEFERELIIKNNLSERVYIEDIDFFQHLNIKKFSKENNYEIVAEDWNGFGEIIGGGDYSNVAGFFSVVLADAVPEYLYLISPSVGRYNSLISFYDIEQNAVPGIFNLSFNEDNELHNYGYKKCSIILEEGENYGNIIFENGSLNFTGNFSKTLYLNYIEAIRDEITLGVYNTENTENYEEDDPAYREPSYRLYNTIYDENTKEIDYFNSQFLVKFTKNLTEEMSIFSIENDWDELKSVEAAKKESVEQAQDYIGGEGVTKKYLIKINIDNIDDVEIDISGDLGEGIDYDINNVVENINDAFRENNNYDFGVYSFFDFAIVSSNNKIILRSPIASSESRIIFKKPSIEASDLTNDLFAINYDENDSFEITGSGDYYITEHKEEITGNFTAGNVEITGISSEDIEKIKPGYKVYERFGLTLKAYVLAVEDNKIKLSNAAIGTQQNVNFYVSNNHMILHRIQNENNRLPDLNFYLHFVNDRRLKEGIFDGEVLFDEETGAQIKTPGYPLGTIDEDKLISFMNDKKIVSIDNIFKQTRFRTFDIKANVYYSSVFSRDDIKQRVETSLRSFYDLENRNFSEPIARSKIMSIIHDNFGVEYVEIDYLGYNATIANSSVENVLTPRFDEILVLSENVLFGGQIIRGLIFNYIIAGK